MKELTSRQQQLLTFIGEHLAEVGYPPTIREMADHMGIRSTNGVSDHLKALERKGYIARERNAKSRALSLVSATPAPKAEDELVVAIPVLGQVAAGLPVLSEENLEGTMPFGRDLLPNAEQLFALGVRGDSMTGRGILEGDTVLVRPQQTARPGQMVVAMIDGETTVKTFRQTAQSIRFEAANPDYAPIIIRRNDFKSTSILGVVVGVFRRVQ